MLGCCIPRDPSKQTNKLINEALERERKAMNDESKLLLLGKKILINIKIELTVFCFKVLENRGRVLSSNK